MSKSHESAQADFNTHCLHGGKWLDPLTQGATTPIYPATSNGFREDTREIYYPRYLNMPNHEAASKKLALLEGAEAGILTSSGMAAISTALFALLAPGDHAVFSGALYGGTHHLVVNEFPKAGIAFTFVHDTDPKAFEAAIQENTKILYMESPSNPLLELIDIRAIATLAKARHLITLLDNTFATPFNQTPIALGIDIILHSGTKYLNGHSDLMCGAILTSDALMRQIRPVAINRGGCLNALDLYLFDRGLKTLGLRMEAQNRNALEIARWLETHPAVERVLYPGLPSHPQHALAKNQMTGFGGMVSVILKDATLADAERVLSHFRLISPTGSLGGLESLCSIPALTSHAGLSPEARKQAGISDGLLRLSIGIETPEALKRDLDQAFRSTFGHLG